MGPILTQWYSWENTAKATHRYTGARWKYLCKNLVKNWVFVPLADKTILLAIIFLKATPAREHILVTLIHSRMAISIFMQKALIKTVAIGFVFQVVCQNSGRFSSSKMI